VRELVKAVRAQGEDPTGPDGRLKALTKTVLETALDEETTERLGHGKHAVEGKSTEGLSVRVRPGEQHLKSESCGSAAVARLWHPLGQRGPGETVANRSPTPTHGRLGTASWALSMAAGRLSMASPASA
jgi:hypothetical protein